MLIDRGSGHDAEKLKAEWGLRLGSSINKGILCDILENLGIQFEKFKKAENNIECCRTQGHYVKSSKKINDNAEYKPDFEHI